MGSLSPIPGEALTSSRQRSSRRARARAPCAKRRPIPIRPPLVSRPEPVRARRRACVHACIHPPYVRLAADWKVLGTAGRGGGKDPAQSGCQGSCQRWGSGNWPSERPAASGAALPWALCLRAGERGGARGRARARRGRGGLPSPLALVRGTGCSAPARSASVARARGPRSAARKRPVVPPPLSSQARSPFSPALLTRKLSTHQYHSPLSSSAPPPTPCQPSPPSPPPLLPPATRPPALPDRSGSVTAPLTSIQAASPPPPSLLTPLHLTPTK